MGTEALFRETGFRPASAAVPCCWGPSRAPRSHRRTANPRARSAAPPTATTTPPPSPPPRRRYQSPALALRRNQSPLAHYAVADPVLALLCRCRRLRLRRALLPSPTPPPSSRAAAVSSPPSHCSRPDTARSRCGTARRRTDSAALALLRRHRAGRFVISVWRGAKPRAHRVPCATSSIVCTIPREFSAVLRTMPISGATQTVPVPRSPRSAKVCSSS